MTYLVIILLAMIICTYFFSEIYLRDLTFESFSNHACDISSICTKDEWLKKRDELDILRYDKILNSNNRKFYFLLDKMMDLKFNAIILDVAELN